MRNHSRGPNGKFTSLKDKGKSLPIAGETQSQRAVDEA